MHSPRRPAPQVLVCSCHVLWRVRILCRWKEKGLEAEGLKDRAWQVQRTGIFIRELLHVTIVLNGDEILGVELVTGELVLE